MRRSTCRWARKSSTWTDRRPRHRSSPRTIAERSGIPLQLRVRAQLIALRSAQRRTAPRPSCAGTACPCRGRSGCASRLPTATRPTPGNGSNAIDCTSSARTPYSSACFSGCRRPHIGSPSPRQSRNGCRRASSSAHDLQPVDILQARDRLEQHHAHQVAVEILGQRGGHRAHGVGGAVLLHQRQRELVRAHREALVVLRVGEQFVAGAGSVRGSCRAALPAGSWPARRPGLPRAAPPGSAPGRGTACRKLRMPAQPGRDFVRAELFLCVSLIASTPLRIRMPPARTSMIGASSVGQRDLQFAAGQGDGDVAVDAPAAHQHRGGRAGAAAAGQGFADAALVHAQADAVGRHAPGRSRRWPTPGTRRCACSSGPDAADRRARRRRRLRSPRADCPSTPRRSAAPSSSHVQHRTRPARAAKPCSGMRGGAKCGTPIAMRIAVVVEARHRRACRPGCRRANVRRRAPSPSRTSHAATQRAPLPHCCDGEPSVFQMR